MTRAHQVRFAPKPGTHRHRVQLAIRPTGPKPVADDTAGRWLAGVGLFGTRDGASALALLRDESRRVRGVALCTAPLACDDAQATEALTTAWSVRGERRLLRRMNRQGRKPAIDAFLDRLAADGQLRDLVDDLAFGSEACVRRHLAHALDRPSERFWAGLAIGHPGVFGELVLARWRAVPGEGDPVTRQLTDRFHGRLAERVPDVALELATLLLDRGIEPARVVWTELLRRRTDATVELAIRHAARLPFGVLANRAKQLAPSTLARIMAHAPRLLGDLARVRTMSADRQQALATAWCETSDRFPAEGTYLLRYLRPSAEREQAYQRWTIAARDRDGIIDARAIAALPIELAAREARRQMTANVALQIDPTRRIAGVARFLAWDELEGAIADHLGHPEGAIRALALTELLANPGVYPDDPSLPGRALALVLARKFEQDPVRLAMFTTLARWPRRVWRAEHLKAVAQAVRDALDASDLSIGTAAAAESVIVRLFGVDPAWAATWLATLIKERGTIHDPNLGAKLSDADITAAAPQLVAIAKTWTTQERVYWLVAFANGLGARMRLVTGLGELIARARDATPYEWYATQLTEVLLRHDPARHAETLAATIARYRKRDWHTAIFAVAQLHGIVGKQQARDRDRRRPVLDPAISAALAEIARELDPKYAPTALGLLRRRDPETYDAVVADCVKRDESVAIVPDVHRWLHRHRQDLLGPYVEDRKIRGAWATGNTGWILPFGDGFFRWSPAQVEKLATKLESIVRDHERDTPSVFAALTIWPRMEYASMDRLCALASDPRPAVQEKAIRVLARCDAGQGVPTLLECLGDARARFAIYGLRRALFGMIPDHALALLAGLPMTKVTVAKEVVRLTGELRAAGAFARLEQLAAGRLHRDIRIALLRALWDHLDRERTWTIFEAAVADPDWVVASRLADIPANRLTAALDRRLAALLGRVLARPEPEARIDLLSRAGGLALVDRDCTLLAACRDRLRSYYDAETRAAVAAVMARSTEDDMPALGAALDALRADPRAFHVAAYALCGHAIQSRASWRRAATALEVVALRDPRWSPIAIQAASVRAIASELVAAIGNVATAGALDHDAMTQAIAAVAAVRDDDLEATVAALAASEHAGVRRIAVAALEHDARSGRGWSKPRLALLATLRRDAAAEVAGAAARVWPPREDDPGS
ncbi:MAG TPA: hypothetical protein VFQ53_37365 [Kofleriaceae bacterium]|nr:hypothetical protein [Kofleriaceae bacterium]